MIRLENVTIRSGDFVIRDVSFTVEVGEYVALMGTTGSGKTTILEAICGLRPVAEGGIFLRGENITQWAPRHRQVGYVPQDLALFPSLSVRQHLEFALRLRKETRSVVASTSQRMAELLGISHLLERGVRQLSGGEAQRVALGRALSFQPQVLLLDEPLSALDEPTRIEMQSLLRRIKRSTGVTTLHVTHNRQEATALADRHLVIDSGQVVARGYDDNHDLDHDDNHDY